MIESQNQGNSRISLVLTKKFPWDSLEVAKAIGITSVVIGHALGGSWIWLVICLFHMPFYFILSGSLFREKQLPVQYFNRKALHLLVPYFSYLILFNYAAIGGFAANLIRGSMNDEKLGFYGEMLGRQVTGGEGLQGVQAVFWFPVCLFLTQQISNIIVRLRKTLAWGVAFLLYVAGYINQYLFPDFWLPLAINVVAGAVPFFMAGRWIVNQFGNWIAKSLVLLFLICCVSVSRLRLGFSFDMKYAYYGFPVLSSLVAVGGYFFAFSVADFINKFRVGAVIAYVGKSSMTIMYLHMPLLMLFASVGWTNWISKSVVSIAVSTVVHWGLSRSVLTSRFFLGNFAAGGAGRLK